MSISEYQLKGDMVYREKINWKQFATLFFIVAFSCINAQDAVSGDAKNGESLFNQHCAACHKLDTKLVGPALGGVVERLETEQGLGVDWLHKWIKNNQELRESGDEYANQVFEEYNEIAMMPFEMLSDQEIDDILAYTSNPPEPEEEEEVAAGDATGAGDSDNGSGFPLGVLIIGFAVLTTLLIWILFRVNTLVKLSNEDAGPLVQDEAKSFAEVFEKNKKFGYALLGLLSLLVMYGLWQFMLGIGVDQGYQPEQPIYFSHKIHAGQQGIDCQYCHSSAKYGKVSGIPTTNVCMNCHYQIQEYNGEYVEDGKSKEFYTEEMQKIYAAIGFDKENLTYTGEVDPIEWTRIHNMPDFVYFNHAQHVVAGEEAIKSAKGVEQVCYACHGRVDEMDEVHMANEFTMGWCIECHRSTEVDMENEYNKEYYANLHEKLKEEYGDDATITVDAIGGLECAKCHY